MRRATPYEGFTATLALLLGSLLMATAVLPALAAERPNLQGKWTLNDDLTARLGARDRAKGEPLGALQEGSRGGFGPPLGRGPEGPSVNGPTTEEYPLGPPQPASEGRAPKTPTFSLVALNELTITQTAGEVTITDKEGLTRVLKTDGSKVRDEKAPGGPAEVRASWQKDGTLTVKMKSDDGQDRTESYIISNDRKHLYLTLVLEGNVLQPELKIRRAYNLAK